MTIIVFTDAGGVPWKVWKASSRLVFHSKTGARKILHLDDRELPDLERLQGEPRTLETLCSQAEEEAA
ncbi:MAG TPA: hypothetical protein VMM18_16125 [Gemmatimonadaceae bacterium]|nr:hypothetical protein [Gemmatimonadaceae bacterium]